MPLEITHILDGGCCTKGFSVPEILCSTGQFAFLIHRTVHAAGASRVREGVLKRHKKIIETPCNDHVVVHRDQDAYDHRSQPHTTQVGMNSFPHTDGTLTEALADGKLEEEERNPQEDQADEVWN